MRKKLIIGIIACSSLLPSIAMAKDPVAMKINGKDVKLSEFEYLYKKNKLQQLEEQSFDKYVNLFVTYKLKVADAEAAGIDTTKTFLNEYNSNRNVLIAPYLDDKTVEDRLANEAYERMKEDVDVWHIMIPLEDVKTKSRSRQIELIDSIRKCAVNGEDFTSLALKFSSDPSVKNNKGHLGFIRSQMLPYSFEYAAYNTPLESISEMVETQFGFHIIKPVARRAAKGQVLVEHIMKLVPRGASAEVSASMKNKMDSIYNLIKAGADFEDMAKRESDDPGSKGNGGKLPWFGTGQMVPEFEAKAFELEKDAICPPFATSYGFHIIKKLDSKGLQPFDEVKDQIIGGIKSDERANMGRIEVLNRLKKQYKYTVSESAKKEIYKELEKRDGYDSTFIDALSNSKKKLITFANQRITIKDLIAKIKGYNKMSLIAGKGLVNRTIDSMGDEAVIEYEKEQIAIKNSELGNLLNEYRDGLLLYEISTRKVWDKSNKDKEGLEKYFEANRDKYAWKEPKFKGYLIQVANDSVAALVKDQLKTMSEDTLTASLRKQFKRNIKVEKVLVAKGENEIIDKLAFGATDAKVDPKFPIAFTFDEKIISAPEEAADVKGAVVMDYQAELENEWIADLKTKYPVVINNKVLNTVK